MMNQHVLKVLAVGIILRFACLQFLPSSIVHSISHSANEDWNRIKEEVALFHNPDVINGSPAITQPPLFLAFWSIFDLAFYERIVLPLLEFFCFAIFLLWDTLTPISHSNHDYFPAYPMSAFMFALNPFSVLSFANHSVGIISVVFTVLTFIAIAKDRPIFASVFCAVGCYISIYPGYILFAVLAQSHKKRSCESIFEFRPHKKRSSLLMPLFAFTFSIGSLLLVTFFLEGSWSFLDHCYLSNIYALNTTPNLGLFWYMYVEMFPHFDTFFVWTMQLIIFGACSGFSLRFYDDPLFLAFVLTTIIGALRPYNSISEFGCSLALSMKWRHLFKYFNGAIVITIVMAVTLILAPLFFFTWLHTATSNANFYFAASLMMGFVRVRLISQWSYGSIRHRFYEKFGQEPRLSTGARVVQRIRA